MVSSVHWTEKGGRHGYSKLGIFHPCLAGDQLDLGGGHTLEFVIAPNLHWPDTMFTFDHKTGILFTCDAFGMHYCSDYLEDVEGVKELLPHYATYYDCLMKPNARSVLTALKKINDFDLKEPQLLGLEVLGYPGLSRCDLSPGRGHGAWPHALAEFGDFR